MQQKRKLLFVLIVVLSAALTITSVIIYRKNTTGATELISVRISKQSHLRSGCTMDAPTSSCMSYEVEVQLESGVMRTYFAPGFSGYESDSHKSYQEISSKLYEAGESDTFINIKVNSSDEITSVE